MTEEVFFERFPQLKTIPQNRKRQMMARLATAPEWLLDCFSVSVLEPGATLVYEGEPLSYVYYVLDGILKAIDYRVFGVEFDYARFMKVYAMGGMEVLMDFKTYRTTLKTVDRCTIVKIKSELFDKWMMTDIHALRYESKMMGEYLLEQGRRAREDLFLPGPERLSRLFVRKYERYAKDGVMQLSITRQELANETGFAVKTVSRAIKSLTEGGFITKCERCYQVDEKQYQGLKKLIEAIVAPESESIVDEN